MFALPVAIVESIQNVDMDTLMAAINEYGPAINVIRKTWTKDTLHELMDGNVAVPDSYINEALLEQLQKDTDGNVKSVEIASHENGRLDIKADTKSIGRIELSGTIEEFVQNTEKSSMTFKVKERALKDHGLMSWFVSRISLSMAEKIMGKVDLGENLPTTIKGNRVTVDFHELMEHSKLAETSLKGHRLLDMIEIQEAVPKEGYIAFKTKVHIPDDVKDEIKSILEGSK